MIKVISAVLSTLAVGTALAVVLYPQRAVKIVDSYKRPSRIRALRGYGKDY